jgi:hypothetical protein
MLRKNLITAALLAGSMAFGAVSVANATTVPVDDRQWDNAGGTTNGDDLTINGNLGAVPGTGTNFGPVTIISGTTTLYDNSFIFDTIATAGTVSFEATIAQASGTGFGIRNFTISLFDLTGSAFDFGTLVIDNADGDTAPDALATTTKDIVDAGGFANSLVASMTFTNSSGQLQFPNVQEAFLDPGKKFLAIISGEAFDNEPNNGGRPSYSVTVSAVPIPAPFVLLISALLGLGFLGRRRLNA